MAAYSNAHGTRKFYNTGAAGVRSKRRDASPSMSGLLSWPDGTEQGNGLEVQHLNRRRVPDHVQEALTWPQPDQNRPVYDKRSQRPDQFAHPRRPKLSNRWVTTNQDSFRYYVADYSTAAVGGGLGVGAPPPPPSPRGRVPPTVDTGAAPEYQEPPLPPQQPSPGSPVRRLASPSWRLRRRQQ